MKILLFSIFVIFLIGIVLTPDTFGSATHFVDIPRGSSTTACSATNTCFTPDRIEIEKGDSVKWRNLDSTVHTATSKNGAFDSGQLLSNIKENENCFPYCSPTFSYTFNENGVYSYFCKIHSWMTGTITVTSIGSDAEVSVCGEGGCAYVDKAQYRVAMGKNVAVKLYGQVTNPGQGNLMFTTITHPNGKITDQQFTRPSSGYFETYMNIEYEDIGKYVVDVRSDRIYIGTLIFEVLDYYTPTPDDDGDKPTDDVGLTVKTGRQAYDKNDMIGVSGTVPVSSISSGSQLTLTITDSKNNIITISQITPNADGTYHRSIYAAGQMWKFEGFYTVTVNYAEQNKSTVFDFTIPDANVMQQQQQEQQQQQQQAFSKTSTLLRLDPLPSTFEEDTVVTFSGKLTTTDRQYYIPNAEIRLEFAGFTYLGKDHYKVTTDDDGKFNQKFTMPLGENFSVLATYDGSSEFRPSKSQTESFAVTQKPSPSPPITPPEDGGPAGGVALLVIIMIVVIAAIAIKRRGKGKSKQPAYQQTPPKPKTKWRKKPKPPKQQGIDDYSGLDLDPLYCPNVKCRSEHLKTKANGQKYCTKCGWNK